MYMLYNMLKKFPTDTDWYDLFCIFAAGKLQKRQIRS